MKFERRKRIWIVDHAFQFRYGRAALFSGLASTFLTASLILIPLWAFDFLTDVSALPPPVFVGMGFAVFFNALILGLYGTMMMHRIAGPLFRISKVLRMIGSGYWGNTKLKLRQTDEMQYLARKINEMIDEIVKISQRDLKIASEIQEKIFKIEKRHKIKDNEEEVKQITTQIEILIKGLKARLGE